MALNISSATSKKETFRKVEEFLEQHHFHIEAKDEDRPWGGFFRIQDGDIQPFINKFFSDIPLSEVKATEKLSPKILVVQSGKRLSWQYHHRRSEIWKVIGGTVKVVISNTDTQTEPLSKNINDVIELKKGQRHRLIGDTMWGIVAEIWQHADPNHPSDEADIVRVQDDFGR